MTEDDALRARLAAADPVAGTVPPALTDDRLERAMNSTVLTSDPAVPTGSPSRRPWLAAAAAAVVLAGAGTAYVATRDDGAADPSGPALELALPGGDPAFMSCLPVEAASLRGAEVAFAGTATAVAEREVRLDVTRWYVGGDAGSVVLRTGPEVEVALLGATEFTVGEQYLVSGSAGTVSVCGLTGPATPELQAAYDEAF